MADLVRLLSGGDVSALTVTGAGGTGKTRLALEVAQCISSEFSRVVFVDLTAAGGAQQVPSVVAAALGIKEEANKPLVTILREHFASSSCLLILDNFEHVLGAASFVASVVSECPSVVVLATSREALALRAERVYFLEPLQVPDESHLHDPAAIRHVPSVVLFEERARARRASFKLADASLPAVAELCVRLDGLPLAIELAAAQSDILAPEVMLKRLVAHAPLVAAGARDLPLRHRTLEATVEWSYELLEPELQAVFRACGVFAGGFTAEAVDSVLDGPGQTTEALVIMAQLVAKSLVRVSDGDTEGPRFYLLDTIRRFALDRLSSHAEAATRRARHAAFYVALAEEVEPNLRGPGMAAAVNRLVAEYGNLRAVFQWATESGDLESGLRLAGALYRFWIARGHLSEARDWLEKALPNAVRVSPRVRAVALTAAGIMAGIQQDHERAIAFLEEGLKVWQLLGDKSWQARTNLNLGLVAWATGRLDEARGRLELTQRLYVEVGDRDGQASAVGSRALVARQRGDLDTATQLLREALVLFLEIGDEWGAANTLANLGHVTLALGDNAGAASAFREALEKRRTLGNVAHIAECFEGLAAVAPERQPRHAAHLLGAAEALRELSGAPVAAAERGRYEKLLARLRQRLRLDTFQAAWREGRELPLEAAIDLALHDSALESADVPHSVRGGSASRLSPREREIAELIRRGQSNREIAENLVLSVNTVETHVKHLFKKLEIGSRAEIAAWAAEQDPLKQNVGR